MISTTKKPGATLTGPARRAAVHHAAEVAGADRSIRTLPEGYAAILSDDSCGCRVCEEPRPLFANQSLAVPSAVLRLR